MQAPARVDQSWKSARLESAASHAKQLSKSLGEISVQALQEIWVQLMNQESTHLNVKLLTELIPIPDEGYCTVERGHELIPKSQIPLHQ